MTAAVHADTGETIEITGTHPVADLFPLLDDEDMEALAADIAANGLAQAVILDRDGQLLDGRNRITACDRAGVKPTYSIYHGPDPVAHILALNNNRRHISKGQRAMVAVIALSKFDNQTDAANAAGVARSYVASASTVLEHAGELADEVRLGAIPLHKAYDRARDNKQREQSEAQRRIPPYLAGRAAPTGADGMTGPDECMNCGQPTTVTKGFDRVGPDGTDQCSQADFHAVVRLPAVWADMADDVLELLRGAA